MVGTEVASEPCPLHEFDCLSIPGRGSSRPRIVFVGEAPGREEIEQRKIFVGPSGKLLSALIKEYSLVPCYIMNVCPCALEGFRAPKASEIKKLAPAVIAKLEKLSPEAVICVGGVALRAVTGKGESLKFSGMKVADTPWKVYALAHPAYVLRTPRFAPVWESQAKAIALDIGTIQGPGEILTQEVSMEEAIERLSWASVASLDFEATSAATLAMGSRLRTVAFYNGKGKPFWVNLEPFPVEEQSRFLNRIHEIPDLKLVSHNVQFEARIFLELTGKIPKGLVYDTMIISHLMDENKAKSLDALAFHHFEAPSWDSAIALHNYDYSKVPIPQLGEYNAKDAYYTFRLYEKLLPEFQRNRLYPQAVKVARLAAEMELNGMKVDLDWTSRVGDLIRKEMEELKDSILRSPAVLKLGIPLEKVNLRSGPTLRKLFFDILKVRVMERTPKGTPSVREDALRRVSNPPPELASYLQWKNLDTLLNLFIDKIPTLLDSKGIVHPRIHTARVVSGRMSMSEPPLQAMPQDKRVRGMIVSRWPGGKILSADYKQLELRIAAALSGEEKMIRAFVENRDPHGMTASLLWGKEYSDEQRYTAKQINFSIIYGAGPHKLVRDFQLRESEAVEIVRKLKIYYPNIFRWLQKVQDQARVTGQVETPWGRVRRLPEAKNLPEDDPAKWRALRQCGNFVVQSTGADLTNRALLIMHKKFREYKEDRKKPLIIHQIHDSVLLDVPPEASLEEVKAIVSQSMAVEAPKPIRLAVPLEVDISVYDRWGGLVLEEKEKNLER